MLYFYPYNGFSYRFIPKCDIYVCIAWSKAVQSEWYNFYHQTCSPSHGIKTLEPGRYCLCAKIETFYVCMVLHFLSQRLYNKKGYAYILKWQNILLVILKRVFWPIQYYSKSTGKNLELKKYMLSCVIVTMPADNLLVQFWSHMYVYL